MREEAFQLRSSTVTLRKVFYRCFNAICPPVTLLKATYADNLHCFVDINKCSFLTLCAFWLVVIKPSYSTSSDARYWTPLWWLVAHSRFYSIHRQLFGKTSHHSRIASMHSIHSTLTSITKSKEALWKMVCIYSYPCSPLMRWPVVRECLKTTPSPLAVGGQPHVSPDPQVMGVKSNCRKRSRIISTHRYSKQPHRHRGTADSKGGWGGWCRLHRGRPPD